MNNYMHERYCTKCEEFKEDHEFRCDTCDSKLWTRIKLKNNDSLINVAEVLRADEVQTGDLVYIRGLLDYNEVYSSSPVNNDDTKQYIAIKGHGSHAYRCDQPFYSVMGSYSGGWE